MGIIIHEEELDFYYVDILFLFFSVNISRSRVYTALLKMHKNARVGFYIFKSNNLSLIFCLIRFGMCH